MSYFEYKVVPAPSRRRRRQKSVEGMDKYASTVADMMTELGREGWDFIGAEALTERRRKFLVLMCDVERTLMIFRRPAEQEVSNEPVAEPVLPRRVSRPDLVAQVAAGARRVHVNVVERVEATDVAQTELDVEKPQHAADARPGEERSKVVTMAPQAPEETPLTGKAHMLERAVRNTKAASNLAAE